MLLKNKDRVLFLALHTLIVMFLVSCDRYVKDDNEDAKVARVGEKFLYKKDIAPFLFVGASKQDSATIVMNYVNNWASKQLLLEKAKINLPENKLREFNDLVADYKTDLYTRAYKEALVEQTSDTLVTKAQMSQFYETEKENFRLKERLVKIRFAHLPKQFLDKKEVIKRMKRFNEDDLKFLDSIGVQFKKLNFNDSIWVSAQRVIDEIPPLTIKNNKKYLKKSQFFELKDALGVYLGKVVDVRKINEVAPLSFIKPTIKQVLLNRRKLEYLRRLETEIIDEAIKENKFEVFTQNE